jgi:hypothetical protein
VIVEIPGKGCGRVQRVGRNKVVVCDGYLAEVRGSSQLAAANWRTGKSDAGEDVNSTGHINLAIQDCVFYRQFSQSDTQEKKVEMILIAGHQFAFVIFYISDCAEAVVLQFEYVIGVAKRFCNALEAHGLDARKHGLL